MSSVENGKKLNKSSVWPEECKRSMSNMKDKENDDGMFGTIKSLREKMIGN